MGPALSVRLPKSQIKGVKKGRDQLYRCPFYKGVCLIGCPFYKGVCLIGCPFYRGVCLMGCPFYRVVCLIDASVLQSCLSYRGVRFTKVSVL